MFFSGLRAERPAECSHTRCVAATTDGVLFVRACEGERERGSRSAVLASSRSLKRYVAATRN